MKTMIIGGSGYLGRHVVAALRERDHEVTVLGRGGAPGLPEDVRQVTGDYLTVDWETTLPGFDAVVFAGGAKDIITPPKPARRYFHEHNVKPLEDLLQAAERAGVQSAVVLGSYYTALDHDGTLARHSPYVHSRAEQIEIARQAALPCAVLEVPFVFGHTPHRPSMYKDLLPWLRGDTRVPLMAPPGGTAVVSAKTVGTAAANALGLKGAYPVAQKNMTYRELITELARGAGHPEPENVKRIPAPLMKAAAHAVDLALPLQRKQPGIPARYYGPLFVSHQYIDLCRPELGISPDDLTPALHELHLDGE